MPNHVTNEVTFLGSTERIKELREKCKGDKSPFSFQAFYPMPDELIGTSSPAKIVTEQELQEWKDKVAKGEVSEWEKDYRPITKDEQNKLKRKYGADNWYDWHIHSWGTKWDCYSHRGEGDDSFVIFETAWSTPIRALVKLSEIFDDITIEVRYADEDFGSNVGTYTLQGGEIVDIYQPDYSKDSIKLAMDILGDMSYWIEDRLIDEGNLLEESDGELDEFNTWLVEIAHEEGNLLEEYAIPVLGKLFDLAVADEQFERAGAIKQMIKLKLNADNLNQ
jgi:hypothetical protein